MIQLAFLPLLKSAGGAIAGLLRSIPAKTWRTILYFALVIAALLYGNHTGKATGLAKGLKERDKVQANWDAAVARGNAAIAAKDAANAVAQAKAFTDGIKVGEDRVRDKDDIIAERDRTIAGLQSGTIRLHDRWQACLSGPQAGDAAALSGGPVSDNELRREVAAEISEGFDADSRITRLIEFQDVLRKQCEAIGGAP